MRTNIDIDDELMAKAMAATGATTKKAAVEASLRQMVQLKEQTKIRKLFGKVVWRGPDDDWFASDAETLQKRRTEQDQDSASRRPRAAKQQPATRMDSR